MTRKEVVKDVGRRVNGGESKQSVYSKKLVTLIRTLPASVATTDPALPIEIPQFISQTASPIKHAKQNNPHENQQTTTKRYLYLLNKTPPKARQ